MQVREKRNFFSKSNPFDLQDALRNNEEIRIIFCCNLLKTVNYFKRNSCDVFNLGVFGIFEDYLYIVYTFMFIQEVILV